MRKLYAGLAMTLDGVTEAPSAGGWFRFDDEVAGIIAAGQADSDAILLGRSTYVEFAGLWPSLPSDVPSARFMNDTRKYVVSSTLTSLDWGPAELLTGDVMSAVAALKALPGKDILVPGSPRLVRSLLLAGLLDELSLMVQPVVFGRGARLLDEISHTVPLELVASQTLRSGVVSLTYRPMSPVPNGVPA